MSPITNFHDLYIRYASDVYRFALFLSGDSELAQEITAETFARALTGKAPLVTSTVKGYLLTIARNLHIESSRRGQRIASLSIELPDTQPQLDEIIEQRIELNAVHTYLQNFPETDRAALLLRAHGLSYDEIAHTLKISLAAAKVKVHRLRLKLAEWRAEREST